MITFWSVGNVFASVLSSIHTGLKAVEKILPSIQQDAQIVEGVTALIPGGAQTALATTVKLSTVVAEDFDAVFYPGGHGPLWDLAEDKHSIALIESMYAAGNPVALVCHAPGALRNVKAQDGSPLVKGKRVTGFTDTEEQAVQLTKVVPFLVEDELKRLGGLYAKGPDWASFVQVDGNLITGQNPASSSAAAQEQLKMLATLQSGAATRSS